MWSNFMKEFVHNLFFHIPQPLWKKSETGVDISGNVPDIVLHVGIGTFQRCGDLIHGIDDSGMIPGKLLADVGEAEVGELADEVHGYLPGFGYTLALLGAAKYHLVYIVELADLTDDQAGGGQGIAFGLEHIADDLGDIVQGQGHIV